MMSVKIIQNVRTKKRDNTYPLKLRIVLNRNTRCMALGHSVSQKDWDNLGQRIKSSCKTIGNAHRINTFLNKEKQKALDVIESLQNEGRLETVSIQEIKDIILGDKGTLY